jgi:hypothetical protein
MSYIYKVFFLKINHNSRMGMAYDPSYSTIDDGRRDIMSLVHLWQ